jgi:hypothetical protein
MNSTPRRTAAAGVASDASGLATHTAQTRRLLVGAARRAPHAHRARRTCKGVCDVHLALVRLAQQHAHHALLGVLGHAVVVVDHAEEDQRVQHHLFWHARHHGCRLTTAMRRAALRADPAGALGRGQQPRECVGSVLMGVWPWMWVPPGCLASSTKHELSNELI